LDWTNVAYGIRAIAYNGANGTSGTSGSATFVVTRTANDSSAPTNAETTAVIGRNPVAGDIVTVPVPEGDRVTFLLAAVIERALPTVMPVAACVMVAAPSTVMVTDPVPESATVTLESPCVIALDDSADTESSTYFLLATSPAADGAAVDSPVILFVEASITTSPTDNPLLTLKFLVVMVPYLPHDC
jgi:hypothetical protein